MKTVPIGAYFFTLALHKAATYLKYYWTWYKRSDKKGLAVYTRYVMHFFQSTWNAFRSSSPLWGKQYIELRNNYWQNTRSQYSKRDLDKNISWHIGIFPLRFYIASTKQKRIAPGRLTSKSAKRPELLCDWAEISGPVCHSLSWIRKHGNTSNEKWHLLTLDSVATSQDTWSSHASLCIKLMRDLGSTCAF